MQDLESEAYYDPKSDCVLIKVRVWEQAKPPNLAKRGLVFKMTMEQFRNMPHIPEACEYPKKSIDALEFVGVEESGNTICNDGLDISMCCKAPTKQVSDSIWICSKCKQ